MSPDAYHALSRGIIVLEQALMALLRPFETLSALKDNEARLETSFSALSVLRAALWQTSVLGVMRLWDKSAKVTIPKLLKKYQTTRRH